MESNGQEQRASLPLLLGTNPVLSRELRVALRNERAFALLAIYVAVLGAIVASQFPSDRTVADTAGEVGAGAGYALLWTFCQAQALLVVILLPALAAGALAQERERQTLEPLLLTPLTPGQIVWGKAAGVLCFGALLLLATLPLTSLSFMLGGVSPADVITAYAVLLGLAAFVTGFGLYCSARWPNATQATLACYSLLPFALGLLVMFMGPGSIVAGVFLITTTLYWLWQLRLRWKKTRLGQLLNIGFDALWALGLLGLFALASLLLAGTYGLGLRIFLIVFVTPYFLFVARLGLERTGEELAKRREPRRPTPEKLNDIKEEWQRAVAPQPIVYLPAHTDNRATLSPAASEETGEWSSLTVTQPAAAQASLAATVPATATPAATVPSKSREGKATYGVRPFLSDNLNPILAKDLRAGLLGKWSYLARFSYVAVIASELYLLVALLQVGSGGWSATRGQSLEAIFAGQFSTWAGMHLTMLMLAGAIFGARSIAPEREQQTLPQLLTAPLSAMTIVGGKMMAVGVYTFYIWVMGAPIAFLLAMLGLISLRAMLGFLAVELVFGAFAAAWGVFCSMRGVTVRRALGWALGGVAVLLTSSLLVQSILSTPALIGNLSGGRAPVPASTFAARVLFPFDVMGSALAVSPSPLATAFLLVSIFIFSVTTAILVFKTAIEFRRYAQTV